MARKALKAKQTPRRSKRAQKARTQKLFKLLNKWLADESGYDERVWPILKKAIEENRAPTRRRFSD